jgi:nucleotide-binding universal stress UspA family protein
MKQSLPSRKKKPVSSTNHPPTRRGSSKIHFPIAIKRILVPLDFSERAKSALTYALPFAEQFDASLELVYVVEPLVYQVEMTYGQMGFPDVEEDLRVQGKNELENIREKEIKKRVHVQCSVRTGKPSAEIIQVAKEDAIDLIVIAAHEHTGMEHLFFGSTAEKIVRFAPCPVLVLRA